MDGACAGAGAAPPRLKVLGLRATPGRQPLRAASAAARCCAVWAEYGRRRLCSQYDSCPAMRAPVSAALPRFSAIVCAATENGRAGRSDEATAPVSLMGSAADRRCKPVAGRRYGRRNPPPADRLARDLLATTCSRCTATASWTRSRWNFCSAAAGASPRTIVSWPTPTLDLE